MQMPPLTEQQQSPPRKRGDSTGAASLSNDVVMIGRRRLTNSSSTGDLGSHRDKTGAPSLPTINASPSTIVSTTSDATLNLRDSIHTPGKRVVSGNDVSAPASRIPRPTMSSSKRQPALSASQSSAMVRRLSGTSALPTSKTSASLASHLGIAAKAMDNESITSSYTTDTMFNAETPTSPVSATASPSALVNILNAYTNAKTPAEVEVVLRRAKLASHSTAFSAREREVLVSLVTRQEEKRKQQQAQMLPPSASSAQMTGERATFDVDHLPSKASLFATPQTARHYGAERTLTGPRASVSGLASSTNSTLNALTASVPARRTRASMTTSSSAARAAREVAAQAAASAPISSRLSTPSSVRDSPALYETVAGRQSSSAISPSPSSLGFSAVDDEEREGDEEIESYIRRRHSRKVAQGARLADLEKLLEFPTDERPAKAYSYRQAEALWGDKLTSVELEEIRTFKEIFFVGQNVDKDARASAEGATAQNGGYDDERGDYLVINHDHLAYRYEVMSLLGRGSFGQVLQCKDHKTGRYVAIKLIRNKRRFHHQALVEVKILENLTKWDPNEEFNVIKVLDSFYFRNHLCISMELLSINLYELIKANSFAGFSTKLIRRITSQVLSSLVLLRRNRVVHCDLKPENILLKHPRKSAIKVIDFGSSCFEHEKVYTYIQSRFYRSPEVILGMNYHTAIDIWSLGCIIAELYSGYPLFPGENEQEQLACIMEVLGIPDRYIVDRSSRKKLFFDSTGAPRPVVNSKGKRRRPSTKTLASVLNCNDDLFIDFLTRCLHWDPERRIKPDAAMRHPWIRRQGGGGMTSSTTSRRISMLPSSSTTSNIVSHAAGTTAASNGFPTSSSSSAGGAPQALTSRRTLASSITTSALSSAAGKSSMGMSTSSSKPSALSGSQSGNPRHERRLSLRTSVNGSNASNTVNPISTSETNKHTPLRSSRRSQQPVQ
jgi:dual specificity tyrosine-phosphorylation-regulated kinase 2/3/4